MQTPIGLHPFQHFETVQAGHHQVQKHDIKRHLAEKPQGLFATCSRCDLMPFEIKASIQKIAIAGIVIDDKDVSRFLVFLDVDIDGSDRPDELRGN